MNPLQAAQQLLALVSEYEPGLLSIPETAADRTPGPEKWSRKQILGHLIDSAANNHQRFIRMQQTAELNFPGYQQDDWVRLNGYAARPWKDLVVLWAAYNRHVAHVMEGIAPEALGHIWDNGTSRYDLARVVADYAAHLRHHLEQIVGEA
ncbi:MAG TPA: DinB family protein [Acidobacteriaceae bacterium]|nr:DinB family protein [Acidobacteriaceae bacterium]